MRFSRRKTDHHFCYNIFGAALRWVDNVKGLGITLDTHLTYACHIDGIVALVDKLLGFLKTQSGDFPDIRTLCVIYSSVVRSLFDYCTII